MHFIFATQGIKPYVDSMMNDLQAQFFPWPMTDAKTGGDIPNQVVQGALRPIQLWMYVFPKESMDEVLNTFGIKPYKGEFNVKAALLRKALNAKKMPIPNPDVPGRLIRTAGVTVIPIGIREDDVRDVTGKGKIHEAL